MAQSPDEGVEFVSSVAAEITEILGDMKTAVEGGDMEALEIATAKLQRINSLFARRNN